MAIAVTCVCSRHSHPAAINALVPIISCFSKTIEHAWPIAPKANIVVAHPMIVAFPFSGPVTATKTVSMAPTRLDVRCSDARRACSSVATTPPLRASPAFASVMVHPIAVTAQTRAFAIQIVANIASSVVPPEDACQTRGNAMVSLLCESFSFQNPNF